MWDSKKLSEISVKRLKESGSDYKNTKNKNFETPLCRFYAKQNSILKVQIRPSRKTIIKENSITLTWSHGSRGSKDRTQKRCC